jgi:hypothetical protein
VPTDIIKVTIKGTFLSGEVWSINPTFGFGDFGTIDPSVPEMNAAAAAINAVNPGTTMRTLLSASGSIAGCRIEARTLAGGLQAVAENNRVSPLPGDTQAVMPPQTSVVVSLRTDTAGGRGRGRLYWPALGALITTSTLRWSETQRTAFLTEAKTYLSAMATALNTAFGEDTAVPVVWSRAAQARPYVTSIQLGNVLDTQRRRRDGMVESYVSTPYP